MAAGKPRCLSQLRRRALTGSSSVRARAAARSLPLRPSRPSPAGACGARSAASPALAGCPPSWRTSARATQRSARRSGESLAELGAALPCSADRPPQPDPRGQRASQRSSARGTGRRRRGRRLPRGPLRPNGRLPRAARSSTEPRRGERPTCSRRHGRQLARSTASSLERSRQRHRDRRRRRSTSSRFVRQSPLTSCRVADVLVDLARMVQAARGRPRTCRRERVSAPSDVLTFASLNRSGAASRSSLHSAIASRTGVGPTRRLKASAASIRARREERARVTLGRPPSRLCCGAVAASPHVHVIDREPGTTESPLVACGREYVDRAERSLEQFGCRDIACRSERRRARPRLAPDTVRSRSSASSAARASASLRGRLVELVQARAPRAAPHVARRQGEELSPGGAGPRPPARRSAARRASPRRRAVHRRVCGKLVCVLAELAAVVRGLLEVVADERVVAAGRRGRARRRRARAGRRGRPSSASRRRRRGAGRGGSGSRRRPGRRRGAAGRSPARESASRFAGDVAGASAATAPRENSRPTTAARWSTRRSPASRRPRRPASTASSVGGSPSPPSAANDGELLDVERVALRELDDPLACLVVERRRVPATSSRASSSSPSGPSTISSRPRAVRAPGRARQSTRSGASYAVGEVVDEVDERGLRPVDVVEHEQHGLLRGRGPPAAGGPPSTTRRAAPSARPRRARPAERARARRPVRAARAAPARPVAARRAGAGTWRPRRARGSVRRAPSSAVPRAARVRGRAASCRSPARRRR